MRVQLHELELAYPPITNQEAEWLKEVPEVVSAFKNSHLYFIGQKPETIFEFEADVSARIAEESSLHFIYVMGTKADSGYIDILALYQLYKLDPKLELEFELGPKQIRIWGLYESGKDIVDWFTTDKMLFDRSRELRIIKGFNQFRDFFVYNLHYVGISKKGTSFERLVIKPHDKRLRILSNEHPLNKGSRVTDEIVLFFFVLKSLEIKQYDNDDDFGEFGQHQLKDQQRIVADAEKAFVKILDTMYNEVKFAEYPFSTDGLYHTSVERHTFSIDENITFITPSSSIVGKRKELKDYFHGDFIAVSKESVSLIKVS